MATEVRSFQVTIPANTAQSSPVTVDTSFDSMTVERIDIKVPAGPSGLMGFQLTMDGNQVIPINSGAWVITDNDNLQWPLTNLPDSGLWQVTGYNTDIYDHTIYINYLVSPVAAAAASVATPATEQVTAMLLGTAAS